MAVPLCVSCMLWYVLYTRSVYSAAMVCMIPTMFCIIVFVAVPLCVSCKLWYVLYTRSVNRAAMLSVIRSMFVFVRVMHAVVYIVHPQCV